MASSSVGNEIFNRDKTGYDSDFLDDSALIEAFDNAVNPIKAMLGDSKAASAAASKGGGPQSQAKKKKNKGKEKLKQPNNGSQDSDKKRAASLPTQSQGWQIGSSCRAVYSEDGVTYDAVIISLDADNDTCVVRYNFYNNEEEQRLSDLLPPSGGDAFQQQQQQQQHHQHHCSHVATDPDSGADGAASADGGRAAGHGNDFRVPSSSRQHRQGRRSRSGQAPNFNTGHGFMPPFIPPSFGIPGMSAGIPGMPLGMPTGIPPVPPLFESFPAFGGHHSADSAKQSFPIIPPPPPPPLTGSRVSDKEKEALYSMLVSWYMSGYHTGFYQGFKQSEATKQSSEDDGGTTTSADLDESYEHDHTHCTGH